MCNDVENIPTSEMRAHHSHLVSHAGVQRCVFLFFRLFCVFIQDEVGLEILAKPARVRNLSMDRATSPGSSGGYMKLIVQHNNTVKWYTLIASGVAA